MSRKEARELAFKTIYSKFFNTDAELEEQTESTKAMATKTKAIPQKTSIPFVE